MNSPKKQFADVLCESSSSDDEINEQLRAVVAQCYDTMEPSQATAAANIRSLIVDDEKKRPLVHNSEEESTRKRRVVAGGQSNRKTSVRSTMRWTEEMVR